MFLMLFLRYGSILVPIQKGELMNSDEIMLSFRCKHRHTAESHPKCYQKYLVSRVAEGELRSLTFKEFKEEISKSAPIKFKRYNAPKYGYMLEIEMPDLHLGKLTWGEESGEDGNMQTQIQSAYDVISELLSYSDQFPIEKVLFPIGHDFYNVDNKFNMTTHGTPQQEDDVWRKSFRTGWKLAKDLIDMCAEVSPVDVPIVSGNHDEERSFYLGEVLSGLYSNSDRVSIDNSPKVRKYRSYGVNLIGMTHGYEETLKELVNMMPYEVPELWSKSLYREWHTGDKHHKDDFVQKTREEGANGVVIRILRSLSTTDMWHYNKGYIGSLRAAEAFLWDKDKGLKAQFTATP